MLYVRGRSWRSVVSAHFIEKKRELSVYFTCLLKRPIFLKIQPKIQISEERVSSDFLTQGSGRITEVVPELFIQSVPRT